MGFFDRFKAKEERESTLTVGGIELVLIPAGEFTMGSEKGGDAEKPARKVYLDAFYIGRYPITNAQYKRFVEATGHESPYASTGRLVPKGKEDHPVVNVTWDDVRAYCEWVSDETGQVLRLPTEAQWEKAARGTRSRKYPWGHKFDKDKCNTLESGIRDTTPVGKYSPAGDSPYGVADMAGNVWEWTSSLHKHYPYSADDGREDPTAKGDRVLRGGSFSYDRGFARVTYRYLVDPDGFLGKLGLRVVLLRPESP